MVVWPAADGPSTCRKLYPELVGFTKASICYCISEPSSAKHVYSLCLQSDGHTIDDKGQPRQRNQHRSRSIQSTLPTLSTLSKTQRYRRRLTSGDRCSLALRTLWSIHVEASLGAQLITTSSGFPMFFGGLRARFEVDVEPSGIRSKIFCPLGRPAPADSFRPQSLRNP